MSVDWQIAEFEAARLELCRDLPAGILDRVRSLVQDEQGQDLVEYALIAGFASLAVYLLPYFSASIQEAWNTVSSKLSHAM